MSKITTLFVIFACLTTAFALNATLAKNFFFVNSANHLSYKLFNTRNGIITYNLEASDNGPIPEYLLLDPVEGSATQILQDILNECGHTKDAVFDRLQYHVKTSTLAYFCTGNNSLLILDERTYAVKNSIPTGISANFKEVMLTADGTSLYVLLMGALYLENQVPSQLVQIDLSTKTLMRIVSFDQGLQTNEYVNGFVSHNSETYALTNTINLRSGVDTISIYSVALTDNNYELFKLKSWTTGASECFITQLYQLGDYIVTNNMTTLLFLDKQGNTVKTYPMIGDKESTSNTVLNVPSIVTQEGSSDLYVLSYEGDLYKLTVENNGSIVRNDIGPAFDFQIAYGNHFTTDLLFTIDSTRSNFSITTLQTSELVYSMPTSYDDFMLTNSTFAVLSNHVLQVFNRQSNALIGNVSLKTPFHLQKETDTLYFSETTSPPYPCVIKQLNLTTLSIVEIQKYTDSYICADLIYHFKVSDNSNLQFVAFDEIDGAFSVVSETYGDVNFYPAEYSTDIEYIVPNFETMSLYFLQSDHVHNDSSVSYWEYNGTFFNKVSSYQLGDTSITSFYDAGNDTAFAFRPGSLKVIDLPNGYTTWHSLPTLTKTVSSFQDNTGKEYFIFSDQRLTGYFWVGNVTQPSLFDSKKVSQLPGTTNFTVQAGSAGPNSYWVADGFISSVGLVKFYDAGAQDTQEDISMFSILQ